MQQKTLVSWLKAMVVIFAVLLAGLLFFLMPALGRQAALQAPQAAFLFWPCLIFIWILGAPVFLVLAEAWKVCQRIAQGSPFCGENAKSFVAIGQYALMDCGILFLGNVILVILDVTMQLNVYHILLPVISMLLIFVGMAVAVAAATLSHLIYKASDINEENQLTI